MYPFLGDIGSILCLVPVIFDEIRKLECGCIAGKVSYGDIGISECQPVPILFKRKRYSVIIYIELRRAAVCIVPVILGESGCIRVYSRKMVPSR